MPRAVVGGFASPVESRAAKAVGRSERWQTRQVALSTGAHLHLRSQNAELSSKPPWGWARLSGAEPACSWAEHLWSWPRGVWAGQEEEEAAAEGLKGWKTLSLPPPPPLKSRWVDACVFYLHRSLSSGLRHSQAPSGTAGGRSPSPHGLTEEVPHFGTSLVQRFWAACASLPVLTAPLFASKKGSTSRSWSFRQSP